MSDITSRIESLNANIEAIDTSEMEHKVKKIIKNYADDTNTMGALGASGTGAAIGTLISPGFGTAAGAGIGYLTGVLRNVVFENQLANSEKKRLQKDMESLEKCCKSLKTSLTSTSNRIDSSISVLRYEKKRLKKDSFGKPLKGINGRIDKSIDELEQINKSINKLQQKLEQISPSGVIRQG